MRRPEGGAQVVALIRAAEDGGAASTALQEAFQMSKQQAEGVLNISLRRLTSLEAQKLEAEDGSLTLRCTHAAAVAPVDTVAALM